MTRLLDHCKKYQKENRALFMKSVNPENSSFAAITGVSFNLKSCIPTPQIRKGGKCMPNLYRSCIVCVKGYLKERQSSELQCAVNIVIVAI